MSARMTKIIVLYKGQDYKIENLKTLGCAVCSVKEKLWCLASL
jgi:hypothetical protein